MIYLTSVSKAFGDHKVLENYSAVLEDGKIYALMGASGAGKTTLLRILAGLEQPDAGTVEGIPAKGRVSMMFQEDRLLEYLDVIGNIRFVSPKADREEILSLMERLGIPKEDCLRRAAVFSGGMKRRVALARTLLAGGDLLLMDEPLKGLDRENAQMAAEVILQEQKGRTIVMSTHSLWEAEYFKAEILQVGEMEEVSDEKLF